MTTDQIEKAHQLTRHKESLLKALEQKADDIRIIDASMSYDEMAPLSVESQDIWPDLAGCLDEVKEEYRRLRHNQITLALTKVDDHLRSLGASIPTATTTPTWLGTLHGQVLPLPEPCPVCKAVHGKWRTCEVLPLDPKGQAGQAKAPLWLLPPSALEAASQAHAHGAAKYGKANWREAKVCASTYISAMMRHLNAWRDREDNDPDSGVTHLAHIIASANILIDAKACGTLEDDRLKKPNT
jgi:hypothetical protein